MKTDEDCTSRNLHDQSLAVGLSSALYLRVNWRKTGKISLRVKPKLYNAIVLSTVLYASESWKFTTVIQLLDVFHLRCLNKIKELSRRHTIRNEF